MSYELKCIGCNKAPAEIDEYVEFSAMDEMSPEEFVRRQEGTYNPVNGHFVCTDCYIKMGQPSSRRGWQAP